MPQSELIKNAVYSFAEANIDNDEHFLVDVIVKGTEGGMLKISVLLDGDKGITIEDCIALSRKISKWMEEAGEAELGLDFAYNLEVSSPGVDFPLQTPRQYRKNIGRRLKVVTNDDVTHEGLLTDVELNGITMDEEKPAPKKAKGPEQPAKAAATDAKGPKKTGKLITEPISIEYVQIKKSHVIVSFR
ncbi:MAG: hypothetical protein V4543_13005 [Bacteroidota bacterium]